MSLDTTQNGVVGLLFAMGVFTQLACYEWEKGEQAEV